MVLNLRSYLAYFIFSGLLAVLLAGCSHLNKLAVSDISRIYKSENIYAPYDCGAFNINDSVTKINIRIPLTNKEKPGKTGSDARNPKKTIHYNLYLSYDNSALIDSGTFVLDTILPATACNYDFPVKARSGDFILEWEYRELLTSRYIRGFIPFSKASSKGADWFKCIDVASGCELNSLVGDQPIRLTCADTSIQTLKGRCFFRKFPAAWPPFVMETREPFNYRVDSSFTLKLNQGSSGIIQSNREGFTIFQSDTSAWEGYTLHHQRNTYPFITSGRLMLEPLRYITTSREYETLAQHKELKAAIDSFWISNAGSTVRALERIREYYGRVEEANRLFFSYSEGWKTDRGMIYIVFGSPNQVFRSNNEEIWIYGEASNYRSLQFNFYSVLNPFTKNDYILQRQPTYKSFWYNAIELWRR